MKKHEWRARARQWEGEAAVLRRHLEAAELDLTTARAWATDAENRLDAMASEQVRVEAQFRNILTALGRDNFHYTANSLNKARRICRGELD